MPTLPRATSKDSSIADKRQLLIVTEAQKAAELQLKTFGEALQTSSFQSLIQVIEPLRTYSLNLSKMLSGINLNYYSQVAEAASKLNRPTSDLLGLPTMRYVPPSDYKHRILMSRIDELQDSIEENVTRGKNEELGINLTQFIPNDGRHKVHRKIADLFLKSAKVSTFHVFTRIKPTYLNNSNKRSKVTIGYFDGGWKNHHRIKVQNIFRYLQKIAKDQGFTFKITSKYTELVKL